MHNLGAEGWAQPRYGEGRLPVDQPRLLGKDLESRKKEKGYHVGAYSWCYCLLELSMWHDPEVA